MSWINFMHFVESGVEFEESHARTGLTLWNRSNIQDMTIGKRNTNKLRQIHFPAPKNCKSPRIWDTSKRDGHELKFIKKGHNRHSREAIKSASDKGINKSLFGKWTKAAAKPNKIYEVECRKNL